jgi:hypothetical protein
MVNHPSRLLVSHAFCTNFIVFGQSWYACCQILTFNVKDIDNASVPNSYAKTWFDNGMHHQFIGLPLLHALPQAMWMT